MDDKILHPHQEEAINALNVDANDIGKEVFNSLNTIQIKDLWDNSGKTRWGIMTQQMWHLKVFLTKLNELQPKRLSMRFNIKLF